MSEENDDILDRETVIDEIMRVRATDDSVYYENESRFELSQLSDGELEEIFFSEFGVWPERIPSEEIDALIDELEIEALIEAEALEGDNVQD